MIVNTPKHTIAENVVKAAGKMSFFDYMDFVLYDKQIGYYSSSAQQIGKDGDFITAPTLDNTFSILLSSYIKDLAQRFALVNILELGAGTGALAEHLSAGLAFMDYHILEKSPKLEALQKTKLVATWHAVAPDNFQGIVLANEILDALPVRRFTNYKDTIKEHFVYCDADLTILEDEATPGMLEDLNRHGIKQMLTPGYITEYCPGYEDFLRNLNMASGSIAIFIDYGFTQEEYYSSSRSMGTLVGHYKHQVIADLLYKPGDMDLTAHVNFSLLLEIACTLDYELIMYDNLANFLLDCIKTYNHELTDLNSFTLRKLLLPQEMGEIFKIMVLKKK